MLRNIVITGITVFFIGITYGLKGNSIKPAVMTKYEEQLAKEWASLEQQMLQKLSLSQDEWVRFTKKNRYRYLSYEKATKKRRKKSSSPISSTLHLLISNLFKNIHIDPKQVELIRYETNKHLQATDSAIYFSEHKLEQYNYSNAEIEASILHELQHILHKDDSFIYLLEKFMEFHGSEQGINRHEFNSLRKNIRHFHEKRADILAGLHAITYAQALLHFYTRIYQLLESDGYVDQDTDTHPSLAKRIAYLKKVCTDMAADPATNKDQIHPQIRI